MQYINNYGRFQDLILLFKIPMGTGRISLKFIDILGMHPEKGLPALVCTQLTFYKVNKQMNSNTNTDTTAIASASFHISHHTVLRVEMIFG